MLQNVRISGLRGIVNTRDPDELTFWDAQQKGVAALGLTDARNGDITPEGKWRRRAGYAQRISGGFVTGYPTRDLSRVYAVTTSGSLVRVWPDWSTTTLAAGLSTVQGDWFEVGPRVYYLNGTDFLVIEGSEAFAWGIPVCPVPTVRASAGNLPAGLYQVTLTYMTPDGREGGALAGTVVEVPEDGGAIQIEGISQIPGYTVNVYLGSTNAHSAEGASWDGALLYWSMNTDQQAVTWNGPVTSLVTPLATQFMQPPNALGAAVGDFWRGRAWLGASYPTRGLSVVYPSEEHDLGNFDPQKAPITIPGAVNMIAGTPAALIIGSDQGVWTWDEDNLSRLCAYGTVPGRSSDLQDDGTLLFWTTHGLCRAPPFANLTEATVGIEPGLTASGKVLDQYGYRRYALLIQRHGEPFNIYQTPGGVWSFEPLLSSASMLSGSITA
jgi:hypothetical protein